MKQNKIEKTIIVDTQKGKLKGFIVNGAAWPEIVLHVTVDPDATGINSIERAAAKAKNVYTLEGVKVNGSTDNLKGTFIVDGKKVNLM